MICSIKCLNSSCAYYLLIIDNYVHTRNCYFLDNVKNNCYNVLYRVSKTKTKKTIFLFYYATC